MKFVGLPTHTSKKPFFRLSKQVFSNNVCPLGGFFAAFLAARDHDKYPGFIPLALIMININTTGLNRSKQELRRG
jgi:hypothetical protein